MSQSDSAPVEPPAQDANTAANKKLFTSLYPKIATVLGIIFTILSIGIVFVPLDYNQLQLTGYSGVFLANLFGSATVLLPAPKTLSVIALATKLNPLFVGIVAGIGSGIGETTGYYIGFAASSYVPQENRFYNKLEKWMSQNGFLTIFICASIPNPLFDVAGLVAGVHRYSVVRFLLAATLGNILKNIAIAYISYFILQ